MNRIVLLLLMACGIFSCVSSSPEQHSETKDSTVLDEAPASEASASEADVPHFKTLDTALSFAGLWVNETYIDNIRRTRSPFLSHGGMLEESCITIPARTLQVTRMVGGFHEGAEDLVVVKENNGYKMYNGALTNMRKDIEIISPERIRIGDQYFGRIANYDSTLADLGILEELLFNGRYETADKKEAAFTLDGRVQGLGEFRRYTPAIDLTAWPYGNFDHIGLETAAGKRVDHGFRFAGDTLVIFKVECFQLDNEGAECDSVAPGDIVYRLLRKKE
jgi:hypothetical protein